jgi:ribonuclease D
MNKMKADKEIEKMEFVLENRLSREFINSLPIIRFEGKVVVVDSEEEADGVLTFLMDNETSVGFDTESKPSFTKGTSYPISLVQLATHDTAYLFQLKKTGFTDQLVRFLEGGNIKKIGVGIKNDIAKLQELRTFTPRGFIDLSKLAAARGIIQVGIRALTARYMGHRLTKTAQKTNWAQPVLTSKQQIYAASDAWICLQIYPRLTADSIDYRQFNEEEKQVRKKEMSQKKARN